MVGTMHTAEAKVINLRDRRDRTQVVADWPVRAGEHDVEGNAPVLQTAVMAAMGFRPRGASPTTTAGLFTGREEVDVDRIQGTTVAELFRSAISVEAVPAALPLRKVA